MLDAYHSVVVICLFNSATLLDLNSRPSVARTLMARLPRLFRTRCRVPCKKSHSCRFRLIKVVFLFHIKKTYTVKSH